MKVANQEEIKLALEEINKKWGIQNDNSDRDTGFIYWCPNIELVKVMAKANECDLNYALHRWYNHQCSKTVENLFCKYGAIPYLDSKDHDIDITICNIPFDVKLTTLSNRYNGDKNLCGRKAKNDYIQWLKENQSKQNRFHTANKIYVVCKNIKEKSNFDTIEAKVKSFMEYFKKHFEEYSNFVEICELINVD